MREWSAVVACAMLTIVVLYLYVSVSCLLAGTANSLLTYALPVQEAKGPGCGSRSANQTAVADLASEGLRLRSELQRAIDEERYTDAAEVRDRLKVVQEESEEAQSQAASVERPARKYQLGQRVKHAKLGYDGVICGYALGI